MFFEPKLVHEFSNVIAILEPKGCRPVDCVLTSSSLRFVCLNCDKMAITEVLKLLECFFFLILSFLQCFFHFYFQNLTYGSSHKSWCHNCHSKCEFSISSLRFSGNVNSIALEDSSMKKLQVMVDLIYVTLVGLHITFLLVFQRYQVLLIISEVPLQVAKKKKVDQQLVIVEGAPLPEYGTCKHFKKSYRWFRYQNLPQNICFIYMKLLLSVF